MPAMSGSVEMACFACGMRGSVKKLTTLDAMYYFCDTCSHAWVNEERALVAHMPERRQGWLNRNAIAPVSS